MNVLYLFFFADFYKSILCQTPSLGNLIFRNPFKGMQDMKVWTDRLFSCSVYSSKTALLIISALFCPCRSVGAEHRLYVHPGSRLSASSFEVKTLGHDVSAFVPLDWQKAQPEVGKHAEINHQFFVGPVSGPHQMLATCLLLHSDLLWTLRCTKEWWDEDICVDEHTAVRFNRPYTGLREQASR